MHAVFAIRKDLRFRKTVLVRRQQVAVGGRCFFIGTVITVPDLENRIRLRLEIFKGHSSILVIPCPDLLFDGKSTCFHLIFEDGFVSRLLYIDRKCPGVWRHRLRPLGRHGLADRICSGWKREGPSRLFVEDLPILRRDCVESEAVRSCFLKRTVLRAVDLERRTFFRHGHITE